MKTTKKLFVLCLVLVLALASVMPSFAWFNHNASNSGYGIYYKREELPVSQNANVTITQTQSYKMDNNKISLNADRNKEFSPSQITSVANGHIQFYKTTITNSGSADAYVSLYLNGEGENNTGLSNSVNVKIGTSFPTINEQIVGKSERHLKVNQPRIYFETRGTKSWTSSNASWKPYLWCKTAGSSSFVSKAMTKADTSKHFPNNTGTSASNSTADYSTYYGDLEENTVEFYIANKNTAATGFDRTRTFTSFVPQTVYSLTGYTTNDANLNAACTTRIESGAMSVPYVLDTVFAALGGSVYVNIPSGNKGCSAAYALENSGDSTYYDLNENTGLLTLKRTGATGGITTTLTGTALGDTCEFDTDVQREQYKSSIPICTNILVPKKVDGANGEVYVEWYISNELTSGSVTVPLDNLYLKY